MDLYFSDQIQIDMANDDHRALTAFLKIHVSTVANISNLENFHRIKEPKKKSTSKLNGSLRLFKVLEKNF